MYEMYANMMLVQNQREGCIQVLVLGDKLVWININMNSIDDETMRLFIKRTKLEKNVNQMKWTKMYEWTNDDANEKESRKRKKLQQSQIAKERIKNIKSPSGNHEKSLSNKN